MKDFYVICDNIRSLENIGSIFRTADAVGVEKIFLCGISGEPPVGEDQKTFFIRNGVIAKTALGAEKTVPFEHCQQTWRLIEKLKRKKVLIIALEQDRSAILYTRFKPSFPLALVVGNEVKGISKEVLKRCDIIISLPMQGKKESLNVSVAFGVAAYSMMRSKFHNAL